MEAGLYEGARCKDFHLRKVGLLPSPCNCFRPRAKPSDSCIPQLGNSLLRFLLVEAAQVTVRSDRRESSLAATSCATCRLMPNCRDDRGP